MMVFAENMSLAWFMNYGHLNCALLKCRRVRVCKKESWARGHQFRDHSRRHAILSAHLACVRLHWPLHRAVIQAQPRSPF
jgi:hypothetical protein